MAKESQQLDELNTESTEEKTIQKDGDEQINDISTKDDEKIETVVHESSELANKNIETEKTKSNETKSNDNENIEANKNEKALDKENIKAENISNQPLEKDNTKVAKDVK